MDTKKIFATIKSYAIITLGLILYVLAWTIFIIPQSGRHFGTDRESMRLLCTSPEASLKRRLKYRTEEFCP